MRSLVAVLSSLIVFSSSALGAQSDELGIEKMELPTPQNGVESINKQGLDGVQVADTASLEPTDKTVAAAALSLPLAQASSSTPAEPLPTPGSTTIPLINISVQTPFSLTDCINGVGNIIESLEKVSKKEATIKTQNVAEVLDSITDYLKDRDDLHYTLVNYKWAPLDRIKVLQKEINRIWPDSDSRQKGVTALSFEVEQADAVISNLKITSQDGEELNNFVGEVVLRHSLPRRYVYHLYNPTDIYAISFDVRKENEEQKSTPIISILAGRADYVEHGKLAVYYLIRAKNELMDEKVEKATATLRFAQGEIENFRRQSRR